MADNVEKLVFQLIAETKEFTARITSALSDAYKKVQDFQKKTTTTLSQALGGSRLATQAEQEFLKLTAVLTKAEDQFQALKTSTLGWRGAAENAGATAEETRGVFEKLVDATQRHKMTLQQAAQAAIESGQIEVRVAQQVLAEKKKRVLTEQELQKSLDVLKQKHMQAGQAAGFMAKEEEKVDVANKKVVTSSNKVAVSLGSIVAGAAALVGINSIIQGLQKGFELLGNAAKAALEFAQAQFNLAFQVAAANNATKGQSGTLKEWQERVEKLRKELRIFSETDVTNAVTKVAILTRAFGINAEEQDKIIKIATIFAQVTGRDLSEALQDVIQYMGGSSVVLDKYGIAVRDTDKAVSAFELGFTEKLQAGTNGLTSQQLALASLHTLFRVANPLIEEFSGYQETLPGQIKEVDSAIADETKKLGEAFDEIVLGMKIVFLNFLQFLTGITESEGFQSVKTFFESSVNLLKLNRDVTSAGGNRFISPEEAGANLTPTFGQTEFDARGLDAATGIRFFTREQLLGSQEDWEKYEAFIKQTVEKIGGHFADLAKDTAAHKPPGIEEFAVPAQPEVVDEKFLDAQEKFGKAIIDAWHDQLEDQRKAFRERQLALEDANQDYIDELEDAERDYERKIDDLTIDTGRDRLDAQQKYLQDLQDLEMEEGEKRNKIEEESHDKQAEILEDYYKKLKELDAQYYFDLRDAVAENDAVAVKRLERKYALERQKLEDNLTDQLNDENQSVERRLEELAEETRNRKAELDRRYQQELDDINLAEQRKLEDLVRWRNRELEDIEIANKRKLEEIEESYREELELVALNYENRLLEITDKLAEEFELEQEALEDLLTLYEEYYGEDGRLTDLIDEFYRHQQDLIGGFDDNLENYENNTQSQQGGVGVSTNQQGNTLNIVISGDGSISDAVIDRLIDQIADALSDAIENIVITNGG